MRPLTNFEKIAHDQTLKKFNEKLRKVNEKFCDGDITIKKRNSLMRELKEEQRQYTVTSGIIQYFGKLFKGEQNV